MRFDLDEEGQLNGREDFLTGWLDEETGTSFGRPVDIEIYENGDIYISDDKAGVVYKLEYKKENIKKGETLNDCVVTGCSGELCAEEQTMSTCEYREAYSCYDTATCERQANGLCGWTMTEELEACLGVFQ